MSGSVPQSSGLGGSSANTHNNSFYTAHITLKNMQDQNEQVKAVSGVGSDADFLSCNKVPVQSLTVKNSNDDHTVPQQTDGSGLDSSQRTYSLPQTSLERRVSQSQHQPPRRSISITKGITPPIIEIVEGDESDIQKDLLDNEMQMDYQSDKSRGAESTESMGIRTRADEILKTYQQRLQKVGKSRFQLRLNLFFSFVKPTSIEAEAYDYLQSVEGSVMNRSDSDDDSIIEKVFSRTQTLSQISAADMDYN